MIEYMTMLKRSILRRLFLIPVLGISFTFVSCDPALWQGIATGLMAIPTPGAGYVAPAPTTTNYSSYSTYPAATTTSTTTTKNTCSRCRGTGSCQTCGGSGKVYDYGPASVISKEKYTHNCGVCNGRGKCGVCDGKGYI